MADTYIALDLETTGLNPRRDRILEIGAARVTDGQVEESYAVFLNSQIKIPAFITELTGIDNAMTDQGMEPARAIRELLDFCEDAPILGHNILFDYSFVKRNAVNMGLEFEKQGIDTLKIARKFLAELPSRSLGAVCAHYGIKQEKSHRALDDALAASALYHCLKKEFIDVSPAAFDPKPLICQIKKEGPITNSQKGYLNDLVKYHRIELSMAVDSLTKNEASRIIDGIILKHGRIKR